jgi:RHS repeat-associated protein
VPKGAPTATPVNEWGSTNLTAAMAPIPADGSEGTTYYLADQVGTTQMELSASGQPIWEGAFSPFGQEIVNGGEQNDPGGVLPDGTDNRYKFTGKERDSESGLDYFGARFYDASMGRFMSPDYNGDDPEPVPYADLANPQSLNLYSYVRNNPLAGIDPDGHDCLETGTVTYSDSSGTTHTELVSSRITPGCIASICMGLLQGFLMLPVKQNNRCRMRPVQRNSG